MIKIVDYGLGNVRAFLAAYKTLGIPADTASTPQAFEDATGIILPGVGAFDDAMSRLDRSGLLPALYRQVFEEGKPILGVCVGMQMLTHRSEEGTRPGLGWLPGEVRLFGPTVKGAARPVPHMGWNDIRATAPTKLFAGLEAGRFYFLHSYYVDCNGDTEVLATCNYDEDFTCAAASGRVFGVQFHPEKSHQWGCRLLENFAGL